MTDPTPDPSGQISPGYYHAEGDPPDTVRYWDGSAWSDAPMPPPPGSAPTRGGVFSQDRFGSVGIRIGAALLDVVFTFMVAVVFILPLVLLDVADDAADAAVANDYTGAGVVVSVVAIIVNVWLVRQFGGTPGKLVLGLRITEADATTTPPSLQAAVMRVVPIAILTNIPFLGTIVGLVVLVLCIVWVSNDSERRSVYDRIADTRVVYKTRLDG